MTESPQPLAFSTSDPESHALIARLANSEYLFVVSDFDGTLADFTEDVYAVEPNQRSLAALEKLAGLPKTTVAALSGRHLDGLRRVFPLGDPVILGGSHGAETSGEDSSISADKVAELNRVGAELEKLTQGYPATQHEEKPFQRVYNVIGLVESDPERAKDALERARAIDPGTLTAQEGKNVIEFSATTANKGTWIETQRDRLARDGKPVTTVFVGDDVTDEEGFKVLGQPPHAGVKVGPGETAATVRVEDIDGVADFFTTLAQARSTRPLP